MVIYPDYDPKAKCPKCGHTIVETEYQKGYHEWVKDEPYYNWIDNIKLKKVVHSCRCHNEHFHRKCKLCGYNWIELVV